MVRIIGHRGAPSSDRRENTLSAFRAAADQGAHGIEIDVRRTADDVLIVYHDAHLDDGRVLRQLAASELPDFVPTLAETLEATQDLWVNIEIKNIPGDPDYDNRHGLATAVAGLLDAYDMADRVLVSSFDIDSVDRLQQLSPHVPVGWLVWGGSNPRSLIERARAHGLDAIHPHDLLVDASFVAAAAEAELQVNVWTVDDGDRIRQLIDLGVDGIITNTPDRAVEVLSAGGGAD